MTQWAYLIPIFPLAAFAVNIFFGRFLKRGAAFVSIAASLASCAVALPAAWTVAGSHGIPFAAQVPWLQLGNVTLNFGYLLDPLSATLLFVVTIIGTLIQVYSIGYMHDDKRFSRFFAYLSLFMAAMLTLVISDNYVLFFMSWEIMGLCSYLLIGFWFEKDSAAEAARKAFLTTRVGDVGFFLGILTLFAASGGNLSFAALPEIAKQAHYLLPLAGLLIFCGTIGKSAQFPLHVWLPDAMEGPTPVSALIHAATMVAAGVFLVARTFPILAPYPEVLNIITIIGGITAFMAAFIALSATDIKKILAYSTISQLGFMVTALGLKGLSAGSFHLMTHAFFKALLFLGAGSVIHGTGTQDIRKMGGLWKHMPHTGTTFFVASLAIAGVPPLAGFWSKDEILLTAFESKNLIAFGLLAVTAFMTAFYMFRLFFLTFMGEARDSHIHAHESPAVMTLPLWALAIGSIFMGLPGSPFMHHWFQGFIHGHAEEVAVNWAVVAFSVGAGLGGILLAAAFYLGGRNLGEAAARTFKPLYELSVHKLWFDEIYTALIIKPFWWKAEKLYQFDQKIIDGAVNGAGTSTVKSSAAQGWFDKRIVDGLVIATGHFTQFLSSVFRKVQTGFIQHYLLIVVSGIILLMFLEVKF